MFIAEDEATAIALQELNQVVTDSHRPLCIWLGAGTSRWLGYPGWKDLAESLHHEFRNVAGYPRAQASRRLTSERYPELFQSCHDSDSRKYHTVLLKQLGPRPLTPLFRRFVDAIKMLQPTRILTTNVDETLEQTLGPISTIQRTDIERGRLTSELAMPALLKLHGSISMIQSLVFTSKEYEQVQANKQYLDCLQQIFADGVVVFLGYGLRDEYIVSTMSAAAHVRPLFGSGPHFAVLAGNQPELPQNIRRVLYNNKRDHLAPIWVVEELIVARAMRGNAIISYPSRDVIPPTEIESIYVLSDVFTYGTWTTSQDLIVTGDDGKPSFLSVGMGFSDAELSPGSFCAIDDLVIGLVSFDVVYVPFTSVARIFNILGENVFIELIKSGALLFMMWDLDIAVGYEDVSEMVKGGMGLIRTPGRSVASGVRSVFAPVPGKAREAEQFWKLIEDHVLVIREEDEKELLPTVRSLLIRPSIRQALGLSELIKPMATPRWSRFPMLRLANVVRFGELCRQLKAASVRLEFGSYQIAGPVFGAVRGIGWLADQASYVLTGGFEMDLRRYLEANRDVVVDLIPAFRGTSEGRAFTKEVRDAVAADASGEVYACINAALRQFIRPHALQQARGAWQQQLYLANRRLTVAPILWTRPDSNEELSTWRRVSARQFKQLLLERKLSPTDLCPCESGEQVRHCCLAALQR